MGDPRLTIARRELATLRSEKTIVLALLIQLFIAAFSSFLVVGLVSLYDPGSVEGYETTVGVTGDAADDLLRVVDEQPSMAGTAYDSQAAARTAFRNGEVDAVLLADRRAGRVFVTATVPDGSVRTTVIVVQLRDALSTFERTERDDRASFLSSTPLDLPPRAGSTPYYGFSYTVLLPLLCFLPVFISGSMVVDSVTEEVDRGTLELLRVAPVSTVDIVDGKVWASAALAPAQAGLWLALLDFNGTTVRHPLALLAVVAALALLVVTLGATIALLSPDRRAAQFLYAVGVLVAFGGSTLLPYSPVNTVARLAVDSVGATYPLLVAGYVALGVAAYVLLRRAVPRIELGE
ncbi:ABC transporter permease [Haloplanus rubicundus]|uniref:ABC transporter permease n=1 Tax=Haloplanus rubicundus TaxID=1547898 RepID=A0A345E4Z1_9EURY|nr:ABC transporter permease [Haloplanus rubicundus]AXG07263.1 ABC transporter permease [Haloplanus rubicundus]